MKLALVTPAAKRQERRERLRNNRNTALALREVFPTNQGQGSYFQFHFCHLTGATRSPIRQVEIFQVRGSE